MSDEHTHDWLNERELADDQAWRDEDPEEPDVELITIPVDAIRKGDRFVREDGVVYWTALGDSGLITTGSGPVVRVHVQFVDGGTQERFWDPGTELEIQRLDTRVPCAHCGSPVEPEWTYCQSCNTHFE